MAEKPLQDILSQQHTYPPVAPNFGAGYTPTTRLDTYDFIDPTTKSDCTGKAVLVTGGNKGVGKAVALSYARAGASHIAIAARSDVADVIAEVHDAAVDAGRRRPSVLGLRMDVCDRASVESAADEVRGQWGRLDVLVSNAGFLARYEKILEGDEDEWWRSFEVNLRGAYLVAKAFVPLMLEGGDKTIVSMASTGAMHFHLGGSSYQISKFALLRLMEFLMAEYADQGLLTYSVHPGGVATDLARRLPEQTQGGDTVAFLTSRRQDWLAGRYLSAMWDMAELFVKKEEIIEKDALKMKMTF